MSISKQFILGLIVQCAGVSFLCAELEPALHHPEQEAEAASKLHALEAFQGKKPNILLFIVDDMGWGDPGCYGGGDAVGAPTPNMDRIAREGLKLTSCYSQPTCSPSRATLMTGRLPIRHGIHRPPMYGEPGGLDGEITAASILHHSGYVTQLVGKWHLGEGWAQQPQNCGYDDFFGFLCVSNAYTEWRDKFFNPELVFDDELRERVVAGFNHHLVHAKRGEELENLEEITIPVMANIDQQFADYTENFLRSMTDSEKPFYLIHSFSKVHFDSYPAPAYEGKSPAKHPYKDGILEVDDIIGRIVGVLEETGMAENTIVFITSDNGPEEETWPDCGTSPFRMGKGTTYEGGVRVPGIVFWPGMVEGGRVSDGLFDFADWFNTSLSLAGALDKMPSDRYIDGVDQTSFLITDEGLSKREKVYYWIMGELSAIRIGAYKYYRKIFQFNNGFGDAMGGMQGSLANLPYGQLYNLYTDPGEQRPILIRKTWMAPMLSQAIHEHVMSLHRWPPRVPQVTIE